MGMPLGKGEFEEWDAMLALKGEKGGFVRKGEWRSGSNEGREGRKGRSVRHSMWCES